MATSKCALLAILLMTNAGVSVRQDPPPPTSPDRLDKLVSKLDQKDCGLQKLSARERDGLAVLIARSARVLVANQRDEDAALALGWSPAREHLENSGYKLMQCAIARANNTSFFVVENGALGRSATKDIPIGFPELSFRDGSYWCRSAALGGIRSIIVEQREYRFTMADWKDF